eukprot:Skav214914  [mRNA]  locus=scaffold2073:21626:30504:- [translate_table: standard]
MHAFRQKTARIACIAVNQAVKRSDVRPNSAAERSKRKKEEEERKKAPPPPPLPDKAARTLPMKRRDPFELRKARKQRRLGLTLEDRGVTAYTRSRYYNAVRRLLPLLEQSVADEDEVVALWIEDQYSEGEGISYVGDALSGLHHYCPQLRGKLSKSWRLFKLWRRIEKPAQAPPFPQSFAEALIGRAIELFDLDLAVVLALGFFGMLRTGELLTLLPIQVLLGPEDAVIQLGATKSGLRRRQDENVIITHRPTIILLQEWLQLRQLENTALLPAYQAGSRMFRDEFRRLLKFFQLPPSFRPYSLRRGGATADFRAHGQMERTLIKGRWGSTQSARIYIQEGLSALVKLQLRKEQAQLLQYYATTFL